MKRLIHILAYIAAFAIGIILLINNHQPKEIDSSILNGVIVAIGITLGKLADGSDLSDWSDGADWSDGSDLSDLSDLSDRSDWSDGRAGELG